MVVVVVVVVVVVDSVVVEAVVESSWGKWIATWISPRESWPNKTN